MLSKEKDSKSKNDEEVFDEIKGLDPSFFELNRTNYISNLKMRFPRLNTNSVVVLQGGRLAPKYDADTNYYYFDQESNFYYLTGVREPNMYFVLDIQSGESALFYEKEPEDSKVWMNVPSTEEIEKKYGIKTYLKEELDRFLQKRNMEVIYILDGLNENSGSPVFSAELNFVGDYAYLNKRINHDKYIYMVLCDTRRVKNEREKKLLKYIAKISNEAHMALMKYMEPYLNERDTENFFLQYLRDKYYTRFMAYGCICASGANAATLHYILNNRDMEPGDIYLTDMGIRFCGYCSDISATFPVNGKFTDKQKNIYNIVLDSNRGVIKNMKPGITTYAECDTLSKKIILKGLQDIGILKEGFTVDEMFDAGLARTFMPHSVGHLVGLDVHDTGLRSITYKSNVILESGNFITVEPGIYFIDFLMDEAEQSPVLSKYINKEELEKYRGFGGVRIEDDVMIEDDWVESYQAELPRTVEEIEAYMKKN
jgi:Xaa-Pro dipeptidase